LTNEEIDAITKIAKDADLPGERYGGLILEMAYAESPALTK
jgi:hypothetical protein